MGVPEGALRLARLTKVVPGRPGGPADQYPPLGPDNGLHLNVHVDDPFATSRELNVLQNFWDTLG
eukprot:15397512-Alexandrium_andersonii.AAC.1